ncbi:hypothetical protein [Schnuerera sp.]|uniref:hypothetical protein n=1 Tax=Schnuerera sp. TaxID=2794844 RepID=UPI002BF3C386|nr:hypothetical protein [Schnuerera sp.]HSH35631.1 hypothetical protein [Schnuerera sp.]
MILKSERLNRAKPIIVLSINTGKMWGFDDADDLRTFFFGRNRKFYKVMREINNE